MFDDGGFEDALVGFELFELGFVVDEQVDLVLDVLGDFGDGLAFGFEGIFFLCWNFSRTNRTSLFTAS